MPPVAFSPTADEVDSINTLCVMEGNGRYNENCRPQEAIISYSLREGFVKRAVAAIQSRPKASFLSENTNSLPWMIGDFGCSQGKNSLPLLLFILSEMGFKSGSVLPNSVSPRATVDMVPLSPSSLASDQRAVVYHTDLPSNDFASLYQVVRNHPESYARAFANRVFPVTVGKSFFERNLPDNLLDFAFSSTACHWLSGMPSALKATTWIHSDRVDPEVRGIWKEWAHKDWKTILCYRAKELKRGGVLLLHNPGQPRFNEQKILIGEVMRDILREMLPGVQDPLTDFTLPFYRRSFEEHTDPEILREAGLELLFAEMRQVPHPFWHLYQQDHDVSRFLDNYVGHIQAINYANLTTSVAKSGLVTADDFVATADTINLSAQQKQKVAISNWVDRYFLTLRRSLAKLIQEDESVVRQLAKDQYNMFMAVRKL